MQSAAHERALMILEQSLKARPVLEVQSLPGDDLSLDTRSVRASARGSARRRPSS